MQTPPRSRSLIDGLDVLVLLGLAALVTGVVELFGWAWGSITGGGLVLLLGLLAALQQSRPAWGPPRQREK